MSFKVYLLLILFFLYTFSLKAQTCGVYMISGKVNRDGKTIKEGDRFPYTGIITVKNKSSVCLENSSGWFFYLKPGVYKLDSCYAIWSKKYFRFDSIANVIQETGCKPIRPSVCRTDYYGDLSDLYYAQGYIAITRAELNETKDSLIIAWKDPKAYTGKYIVRFYNLYDEPIGCEFSVSNFLKIPVIKQEEDNFDGIKFEVLTQDCRISQEGLLFMRK